MSSVLLLQDGQRREKPVELDSETQVELWSA